MSTRIPSRIKILSNLCLIGTSGDNIIVANFSAKINSPPPNTINIVKNIFKGRAKMGPIRAYNRGTLSSSIIFYETINGRELVCNLSGWAINDLVLSGFVEKGGLIKEGAEFVVGTYGPHHSMVLKDGECYNQITK